MQVTKKQFVSGTIWKLLENFGTRGVSFVIAIVLARILMPEDYGIIAFTTVFTALSDILIQGGFSTALIQKKNVDDVDYSTIFFLNLLISGVLYAAIFLAAPFVSSYYEEPALCWVLRILSLMLFLQAFSATRTAMLTREMKFRMLFSTSIISNLISGGIGIAMAYFGFGVWALVAQQLSSQLLLTLILYIRLKWKPVFVFSKERIKTLFPFSIKVLGSSLLSYIGDSIFSVVIGKSYSMDDLAYTNRGGQIPRELSLYTFGAVSSTLLPMLSSYQDDVLRVKAMVRRVVSFCCYIIFPMMTWLCLTASPLTEVLLSAKWLPSVPILQWTCLYYAATPLMLINVQVFFAMGKSGIRMRTEMVNLVLMVISLVTIVFLVKGDIYMLAAARAGVAVILLFVTAFEVYRLIRYNLKEMLQDIIKPLFASLFMAAALYAAGKIPVSPFPMLLLQSLTAFLTYLLFSVLFKIQGYYELLKIIKEMFRRKKPADTGETP